MKTLSRGPLLMDFGVLALDSPGSIVRSSIGGCRPPDITKNE